jgi:hypothetical protein
MNPIIEVTLYYNGYANWWVEVEESGKQIGPDYNFTNRKDAYAFAKLIAKALNAKYFHEHITHEV